MINPFQKIDVTLSLSKSELAIITKCLQNSSPSGKTEEIMIYGLYAQFQRKLEELEK